LISRIDEDLRDIPYDFLSKYLGGDPLTIECTVVFNGLSLSTLNALPDTGANGYLFVNTSFAEKLKQYLQLEEIRGFRPHPVGSYDGKSTQYIDHALIGHLRIQGRTVPRVPFLVLNMKNDLIIGRKWFDAHDVQVDCRRRCLSFPEDWAPSPVPPCEIAMDQAGEGLIQNPEFAEDCRRRAALMTREDKQRQDGRALSGPGPRRYTKQEWEERRKQVAQRIEELERLPEPRTHLPDCRRISAHLHHRMSLPRGVLRRHPEMKQMQADINDDTPYDPIDVAVVSLNVIMKMAAHGPLAVTCL
jgi:predicted aspartyl protease